MTNLWSRFSTREKVIALLCGLTVCMALAWDGVLLPLDSFMNELNFKIASKQILLAKYERFTQPGLRPSLPNRTEARSKKTEDSEDLPAFLKDIETLAKNASVRVVNLKPLPAAKTKGDTIQSIEMEIRSPFGPISRFLYELRGSSFFIHVGRFSLTQTEGSPDMTLNLIVQRTVQEGGPNK